MNTVWAEWPIVVALVCRSVRLSTAWPAIVALAVTVFAATTSRPLAAEMTVGGIMTEAMLIVPGGAPANHLRQACEKRRLTHSNIETYTKLRVVPPEGHNGP